MNSIRGKIIIDKFVLISGIFIYVCVCACVSVYVLYVCVFTYIQKLRKRERQTERIFGLTYIFAI